MRGTNKEPETFAKSSQKIQQSYHFQRGQSNSSQQTAKDLLCAGTGVNIWRRYTRCSPHEYKEICMFGGEGEGEGVGVVWIGRTEQERNFIHAHSHITPSLKIEKQRSI